MEMKEWEAEFFALDYSTGDMVKVISQHRFQGINFGEAQRSMVKANMSSWLRLTGNWFAGEANKATVVEDKPEFISEDKPQYNINVQGIVDDMDMDGFTDWLTACTEDEVRAILPQFLQGNFREHVKIIKGHLTHYYGDED